MQLNIEISPLHLFVLIFNAHDLNNRMACIMNLKGIKNYTIIYIIAVST